MKNIRSAVRFASFLFFAGACVLIATPAMAGPKVFGLFWSSSHFVDHDYEPYLQTAKVPHHSQWSQEEWAAEDWVKKSESGMTLINDFYRADIIRDQTEGRDDVPVLIVGPNFYHLGQKDQRRVTDTVDFIFRITKDNPSGIYRLQDWQTCKTIGYYSEAGLQIL